MKKKANLIVLTQNLMLESIEGIITEIDKNYPIVLLTSQCLFDNEKQFIEKKIGPFEEYTFASFLSDYDMEYCDRESFVEERNDLKDYYSKIKRKKNEILINRILNIFEPVAKIILCDDLGIDLHIWVQAGFQKLLLKYYYYPEKNSDAPKGSKLEAIKRYAKAPVFSTFYAGKKYVFYGSLNRIGYRMDVEFKRDRKENWSFIFTAASKKIFGKAICRKNVEHISTLHESTKWHFPNLTNYKVGIIQDGYLPPNYSSFYLKFINPNEHYYAWDTLGMQVFRNQSIAVQMLPFRKKLYIPEPAFRRVKSVLCVASGAGDWTAMKNRSDEDMMIITFAKIAKRHPEIKFVYRCHPTWIHPTHQGVNSINRVAEYFAWLGLPNLVLSGNIPTTNLDNFQLSFSRNSLDEDLKEADIVFGEHSVSMIDAAFKEIPFASVNMTGRRDFFCGMTALGFPHCESLDEIEAVIQGCEDREFIDNYSKAIERYNQMTDED